MAVSPKEHLYEMREHLLREAGRCDPDMSPSILKMLEMCNAFIGAGDDEQQRDQLASTFIRQLSLMEELARRTLGKKGLWLDSVSR
jgi:hypothetical protein